jgi:hypothetical protein
MDIDEETEMESILAGTSTLFCASVKAQVWVGGFSVRISFFLQIQTSVPSVARLE